MSSKFIFFLLFVLLISCQKDLQSHLIQPPKRRGDNVEALFPYIKYTSVKSYSVNKPDTIFIANRKFPVREIGNFRDSL
jgi:hypothetical protein